MTKSVVLLSGGLDSATVLAYAVDQGFGCYALSFRYGQRHRAELKAAAAVARSLGAIQHRVMSLDIGQLGGSALTDHSIPVPESGQSGIPITYVPARNTVFLSCALAWAEVLNAHTIMIGVNAVDYSGYPDCRPQFIEAFERVARLGTKLGVEGEEMRIVAPLINLTKPEIIRLGTDLGVDYSLTISCYQPDSEGLACRRCDSCRLRANGFTTANIVDPTCYREDW